VPAAGKQFRATLLERQAAASAATMRRLLLRSRDRIERTILRAAARGDFMAAANVRDAAYRQVRNEYVKLQGGVDLWTRREARNVARQWHELAIDDLPGGADALTWAQFDKGFLDDTIARVHPSSSASVAAVNAGKLAPRLGGMLEADINFLRSNYVEVQRLGAASGMTLREMQKEMLSRVAKETPGFQFIDVAGRKWKSNNYFKMLTKTITLNVSRDTYAETTTQAGYDVHVIEGNVIPTSHEACRKWAGKLVSMTGATPGLPTISQAIAEGLYHPNCRHYTAVVLPSERDDFEAAEAAVDAKRNDEAFTSTPGAGPGLTPADNIDKPVVIQPPKPKKKKATKPKPAPKRRASLAGDKGEVIQVEGGYIDIQYKDTKFSPRGQSVVDFVVEESKRGEGIGKTLLDKALKKHPDLGGQVSSRAALKVAHNAGMRNPSNPDATLEKLFKQLESDTSVFMAINDEAGRSSAAKSVAKGSARKGSSSNKKTGGEVKVKASKGRKAHTRRKPKQH